jgi:glycosyltransferase involved in cell wall biosynthesis
MPLVSAEVPDVYLILWGDGPERAALETLSRTLKIEERVRFVGYWPNASAWLGLLDVFVLPSLSEGSPNALLEALAAGRPVVATCVGGIPELARDGTEALLVPPRDAQALAEAILRVLQDQTLARRLAEAAQEAADGYSLDRYVASLRRLYVDVVADNPRREA